MKQLLINSEGLETRAALIEDGKLENYFIERSDEHHLVGSIFKGVIRNLEPSLQAAFVDIGAGKNAFLHYWDMLPATQDMLEEESDQPTREQHRDPRSEDKDEKSPQAPQQAGGVLASLKRKFRREVKDEQPRNKGGRRGRGRGRGRNQQKTRTSNYTVEEIPNLFPVNSEILVQVTKGPIGTKGARVTTNLSLPGRFVVLLPNSSHIGVSKRIEDRKERDRLRQILRKLPLPSNMGVICRTIGADKKESTFQQDVGFILGEWEKAEKRIKNDRPPCCVYEEPHLAERVLRDYLTENVNEIVSDAPEIQELAIELSRRTQRGKRARCRLYKGPQPLFSKYKLAGQIDNIFKRQVALPGGGSICVDETEALIAIDVNTGKNRAGKDHPETILNTNLEAVDEIARQLRLRNLGGLLVLDLIDMRSRNDRATVFKALKDALSTDRAKTKVYPISPLGLVEMTRQREYESLQDTVYAECPYCSGKGLVKSATSISVEIQRRLQAIMRQRKRQQVRVTVHPHVLDRLRNEDAALLREMEEELGGELSFRSDPELHLEEFRIADLNNGREL